MSPLPATASGRRRDLPLDGRRPDHPPVARRDRAQHPLPAVWHQHGPAGRDGDLGRHLGARRAPPDPSGLLDRPERGLVERAPVREDEERPVEADRRRRRRVARQVVRPQEPGHVIVRPHHRELVDGDRRHAWRDGRPPGRAGVRVAPDGAFRGDLIEAHLRAGVPRVGTIARRELDHRRRQRDAAGLFEPARGPQGHPPPTLTVWRQPVHETARAGDDRAIPADDERNRTPRHRRARQRQHDPDGPGRGRALGGGCGWSAAGRGGASATAPGRRRRRGRADRAMPRRCQEPSRSDTTDGTPSSERADPGSSVASQPTPAATRAISARPM